MSKQPDHTSQATGLCFSRQNCGTCFQNESGVFDTSISCHQELSEGTSIKGFLEDMEGSPSVINMQDAILEWEGTCGGQRWAASVFFQVGVVQVPAI